MCVVRVLLECRMISIARFLCSCQILMEVEMEMAMEVEVDTAIPTRTHAPRLRSTILKWVRRRGFAAHAARSHAGTGEPRWKYHSAQCRLSTWARMTLHYAYCERSADSADATVSKTQAAPRSCKNPSNVLQPSGNCWKADSLTFPIPSPGTI